VSKPETDQNAGGVLASYDNRARGRMSSILVAALLCLACAFAVGIQIANLPSVLRSRAESALASGDFSAAMKFFIRIRRIERDSAPSEPKMRAIARTGISEHYERSKALFAEGKLREALAEYAPGMSLAEDYFFVFPTQQLLAPKNDDLLALLDTIRDDSCFMGKVHSLRSEWDKAIARLQECEKQSGSKSAALFWQTYVSSITWDWDSATVALPKLLKASGMGLLLKDFEKRSREEKVAKTTIEALVPDSLRPDWTLVESLKWYDLSRLVERMGMRLVFSGNREIGSTGVLAPCDIVVRSAGHRNGNYGDILTNGADVSTNLRGYNLVAIDRNSGKLIAADRFDAVSRPKDNQKLKRVIGDLSSGTIVVLAAKGKTKVNADLVRTFKSIGATFAMKEPDRLEWSHCVIGVKGAPPGSALEMHGRGASFLEVCGPRDFGADRDDVETYLRKKAADEERPVIYLFGKRLDSDVLFARP